MKTISTRKAVPADKDIFADLFLMSANYFTVLFGPKIRSCLAQLFTLPANLFSHEHVTIALLDNIAAGMVLGYDSNIKKEQNFRTGLLLLRTLREHFIEALPSLLKLNRTVGTLGEGEFYLSNIATDNRFRKMGIGEHLMRFTEKVAREVGATWIVLDVEYDNLNAIRLYHRLSFQTIQEFQVELSPYHKLHFIRMKKRVEPQ